MTTPDPFAPGYRLTDGNKLNNRLANPVWSVSETFTATVGGTVVTSAKITNTITNVTTAGALNAGVLAPQALPGAVLVIANNSANQIVVFADGGSTIGGLPGNIGYALGTGGVLQLNAVAAKQWAVAAMPGVAASLWPFLADPTSANLAAAVTDETGSGSLVFANTPTLVTPILGTPQSGTLTNCSGLPISTGISGLGTNVATALAVNVGVAGAFVVNGGALGTPSSGTLSSCTGLPLATGISGFGANVATWLATPSSANLAAALTDETGSGLAVFGTSPTLTTPRIAGSSTGYTTIGSANAGASNFTATIPAENMTFGFRNIPQVSKTGAYSLEADNNGKYVSITTGGVTVNASVFSAGDVVTVYNNSNATQTITQGSNVTLRLAGSATTGSRTIAAYGVATLLCDVGGANPVFVVTGNVT